MKTEWLAEFDGHQIRVVNPWFSGAKLYIDGECRDTDHRFFSVNWSTPALSARLEQGNTKSALVEIYCKAIFVVNVRILVNGEALSTRRH